MPASEDDWVRGKRVKMTEVVLIPASQRDKTFWAFITDFRHDEGMSRSRNIPPLLGDDHHDQLMRTRREKERDKHRGSL